MERPMEHLAIGFRLAARFRRASPKARALVVWRLRRIALLWSIYGRCAIVGPYRSLCIGSPRTDDHTAGFPKPHRVLFVAVRSLFRVPVRSDARVEEVAIFVSVARPLRREK